MVIGVAGGLSAASTAAVTDFALARFLRSS
jgi:hypothetical protein